MSGYMFILWKLVCIGRQLKYHISCDLMWSQVSISDDDLLMALKVLQDNIGEVETVTAAEEALESFIEEEEEGNYLLVIFHNLVQSFTVFEKEIDSSTTSGMLFNKNKIT